MSENIYYLQFHLKDSNEICGLYNNKVIIHLTFEKFNLWCCLKVCFNLFVFQQYNVVIQNTYCLKGKFKVKKKQTKKTHTNG